MSANDTVSGSSICQTKGETFKGEHLSSPLIYFNDRLECGSTKKKKKKKAILMNRFVFVSTNNHKG